MTEERDGTPSMFGDERPAWMRTPGAHPLPQHPSLEAIGAQRDLRPDELRELNDAVVRVWRLMLDGEWHTREEICIAAGRGGVPASEGLRRMRALRSLYVIDKRRVDDNRREWLYRLTRELTVDEIRARHATLAHANH